MARVSFGVDATAWSPLFSLDPMRSTIVRYHGSTDWTLLENNEVYSGNRSFGARVDKAIVVFREYAEHRPLIGLLGSHVDEDVVVGTEKFKMRVIEGVLNEAYRYKWASDDFEKDPRTQKVLTLLASDLVVIPLAQFF